MDLLNMTNRAQVYKKVRGHFFKPKLSNLVANYSSSEKKHKI